MKFTAEKLFYNSTATEAKMIIFNGEFLLLSLVLTSWESPAFDK